MFTKRTDLAVESMNCTGGHKAYRRFGVFVDTEKFKNKRYKGTCQKRRRRRLSESLRAAI